MYYRMRQVSAPCALYSGNRANQAARLPRLGVLGSARAILRSGQRAVIHIRPGTGHARGQPHRTRLHRRQLGRSAISRAARHGICIAGGQHVPRRRAGIDRRTDRLRHPLRSAGKQTASQRDPELRRVAGARTGLAASGARGGRVGAHRLRYLLEATRRAQRGLSVRTQPPVPFGRESAGLDRLVSSQPTEHVHGQADRTDAAGGVRPRPRENIRLGGRAGPTGL